MHSLIISIYATRYNINSMAIGSQLRPDYLAVILAYRYYDNISSFSSFGLVKKYVSNRLIKLTLIPIFLNKLPRMLPPMLLNNISF